MSGPIRKATVASTSWTRCVRAPHLLMGVNDEAEGTHSARQSATASVKAVKISIAQLLPVQWIQGQAASLPERKGPSRRMQPTVTYLGRSLLISAHHFWNSSAVRTVTNPRIRA